MKHILIYGLVLAGCAGLTLPAQAFGRGAGAGQFQRSGAYQNSRGGQGTFSQNLSHQPGSTSGSSSWTNARGTGTHSFNFNWNKTAGTGTRSASTTFADGKTASSQGTVTKTAPGDFSYSGTHTGVNGQATDVNKTSSFNPATDTRTVDKTYTNPTTDKSASIDKTVAYDPAAGTRTVDTTATGPNSKTATSDQTFTKTSNGYTRDGTVTGPHDKTAADQSTVTYTKDPNGEITRTQATAVTGANGQTHTGSNTETYSQSFTPAPPAPQP